MDSTRFSLNWASQLLERRRHEECGRHPQESQDRTNRFLKEISALIARDSGKVNAVVLTQIEVAYCDLLTRKYIWDTGINHPVQDVKDLQKLSRHDRLMVALEVFHKWDSTRIRATVVS